MEKEVSPEECKLNFILCSPRRTPLDVRALNQNLEMPGSGQESGILEQCESTENLAPFLNC